MGTIRTYRDLMVWQKAREMALLTIEFVEGFPRTRAFDLEGEPLDQ